MALWIHYIGLCYQSLIRGSCTTNNVYQDKQRQNWATESAEIPGLCISWATGPQTWPGSPSGSVLVKFERVRCGNFWMIFMQQKTGNPASEAIIRKSPINITAYHQARTYFMLIREVASSNRGYDSVVCWLIRGSADKIIIGLEYLVSIISNLPSIAKILHQNTVSVTRCVSQLHGSAELPCRLHGVSSCAIKTLVCFSRHCAMKHAITASLRVSRCVAMLWIIPANADTKLNETLGPEKPRILVTFGIPSRQHVKVVMYITMQCDVMMIFARSHLGTWISEFLNLIFSSPLNVFLCCMLIEAAGRIQTIEWQVTESGYTVYSTILATQEMKCDNIKDTCVWQV